MTHPVPASPVLKITDRLSFNVEAVTQKFAWLGRSGSGKTFGAKRFVEQMLHAGAQVIVLDTVGVWFGLRQEPRAFDVPVLGGLYGDIDLEPTAGALVAEVAASSGQSLVLDLSQMSDAAKARFAETFGRRLFELKKQKPGAMHLVLDEGQDIVPQNPEADEKMMLHQWVRIAKQGRAFGMGLSICSQRPQEVNKKALNQAECVMAFQLTGPHERKALEYWLADKGLLVDGVETTKLSDVLTQLEVGVPFVWSPQWLKCSGVQGKILPIESADTSATPTVGGVVRTFSMRDIDLGHLKASMAAMIEEAQESDPKLLKQRIAALEAQLRSAAPTAAPALVSFLTALRAQNKSTYDAAFDAVVAARDLGVKLTALQKSALKDEEFGGVLSELQAPQGKLKPKKIQSLVWNPPERLAKPTKSETKLAKSAAPRDASALTPGESAVLTAAFQHGDRGVSLAAVHIMTGYKTRTIQNLTVALVAKRAVVRAERGRIVITPLGVSLAPVGTKPYPRGKKLLQQLIQELPAGESKMLALVSDAHPKEVSLTQVQEETGYSIRSVQNLAVHLVARGAIKRAGPGRVQIHPEVFA